MTPHPQRSFLGYPGFLVVKQTARGLLLLCKRSRRESAERALARVRRGWPGKYAIVRSTNVYYLDADKNHPTRKLRPGVIIPANSVDWPSSGRAAGVRLFVDTCSECCRNYRQHSLEYRCPITRGNEVCDLVAAITVEEPC